jgi:hypothetical protein
MTDLSKKDLAIIGENLSKAYQLGTAALGDDLKGCFALASACGRFPRNDDQRTA